jgi:hypothetical protein
MAMETLTFNCETYYCEPCSLKQGTLVKELVRMIPTSVIAFGKVIGDEYYCCPVCFDPKFTVKGRKKVGDGARVKRKSASVGEDFGPGPRDAGATRSHLTVVTDDRSSDGSDA